MLGDAVAGYRSLDKYFQDIRALFEFINVRFSIPEYGTRLRPVSGHRLYSNANSYQLYDDSPYPFYVWLPSWLGRFYIDPDCVPDGVGIDECPTEAARLIGFVWPWLGMDDAYVADSVRPECWIGVAEPNPLDPAQSVADTADMIFKHFRIEFSTGTEPGGWAKGNFNPNEIGCNLQGCWYVRRVSLEKLVNYYEIEQNIIRPLGSKFNSLTEKGVSYFGREAQHIVAGDGIGLCSLVLPGPRVTRPAASGRGPFGCYSAGRAPRRWAMPLCRWRHLSRCCRPADPPRPSACYSWPGWSPAYARSWSAASGLIACRACGQWWYQTWCAPRSKEASPRRSSIIMVAFGRYSWARSPITWRPASSLRPRGA